MSMLPAGFEHTISAGERAEDLRPRQSGHWDRQKMVLFIKESLLQDNYYVAKISKEFLWMIHQKGLRLSGRCC
jgi:hypothetical protein